MPDDEDPGLAGPPKSRIVAMHDGSRRVLPEFSEMPSLLDVRVEALKKGPTLTCSMRGVWACGAHVTPFASWSRSAVTRVMLHPDHLLHGDVRISIFQAGRLPFSAAASSGEARRPISHVAAEAAHEPGSGRGWTSERVAEAMRRAVEAGRDAAPEPLTMTQADGVLRQVTRPERVGDALMPGRRRPVADRSGSGSVCARGDVQHGQSS